ncbi:MAG: hypothetical protein ACI4TH_01935 [Candidatus Ornithomonoglobus sp.]
MRKTKFKKWFLAAFCMLLTAVFTLAPAYAADDDGTEEETTRIRVSLSLPEGCDYTDDGITVTVSIGRLLSTAGGGRVSGDGHIGYSGIYESTPVAAYRNRIIVLQSMEITFNEGETEKTAEFDVDNKLSGIPRAQYLINDDKYMGIGTARITDYSAVLGIDCVEKISLSGTVTLTDIEEDVPYTVYAEENRRIEDNSIIYDYADVFHGTVPAEIGVSEYTLNIKPDKDYSLFITFDDNEFVRQSKEISKGTQDITVDFDSFERSPEITGTVRLPDSITDEEVWGSVFVQTADAPYYEIMWDSFSFEEGSRECGFTLRNDLDADKVIVYYMIFSETEGLYYGGNYLSDTECVKNVSEAAILDGSGGNIILNLIEQDLAYPIEVGTPCITADNKYAIEIFNSGSSIYDLKIYIADYDNGILTGITQQTANAYSHEDITVEFEKTSDRQSMFIWDGMKPAALKTELTD